MNETELPKYVIIPYPAMDELMKRLGKIEKMLEDSKSRDGPLGNYITEKDAMKLLDKGTTWFWNQRKAGTLKGKKAGNCWYYQYSDIILFIDNGKTD